MARVGPEAFDREYQKRVGQKARKLLHENSLELVNRMRENELIDQKFHYFEIGAAGARNLYYIWKDSKGIFGFRSPIKLSCNDLWEEESKANMHPDIRKIINFHEGDTEEILSTINPSPPIDVLLSSDHLMHLPRFKGEAILTLVMNRIRPKYIVLRERKKEYEVDENMTDGFAKNYHNYEKLAERYELVNEYDCKVNEYFIRIYKKLS